MRQQTPLKIPNKNYFENFSVWVALLHLERRTQLVKLVFSIHFANARNYVPYESIKHILISHVFLSS